jgi:hypothetical protein
LTKKKSLREMEKKEESDKKMPDHAEESTGKANRTKDMDVER